MRTTTRRSAAGLVVAEPSQCRSGRRKARAGASPEAPGSTPSRRCGIRRPRTSSAQQVPACRRHPTERRRGWSGRRERRPRGKRQPTRLEMDITDASANSRPLAQAQPKRGGRRREAAAPRQTGGTTEGLTLPPTRSLPRSHRRLTRGGVRQEEAAPRQPGGLGEGLARPRIRFSLSPVAVEEEAGGEGVCP